MSEMCFTRCAGFFNRSRRKTIPDIYICNLAVADLVHIIGMPFLIHQWARGGEWVFGSALCTIITSLDTCNQFACTAIMTAMSLDRYMALVQPFRLTSLRTISKTIRVNILLWAASFVVVFPVWVYSKVIEFKDGLESCAFDLTTPNDVLWYTLYLTITTFFFPLPLIVACYILILCYTWEMYHQNKTAGRTPSTHINCCPAALDLQNNCKHPEVMEVTLGSAADIISVRFSVISLDDYQGKSCMCQARSRKGYSLSHPRLPLTPTIPPKIKNASKQCHQEAMRNLALAMIY
ncbi:melanin-concentrating hormone receptor 2 [Pelobates cultripes]|uniref:Melanin-concentrating hormone receptor 2 n=1 Tax=Pelobates cultripes TaxID=61616 RepID=A0AAD1VVK2_PELCU|nr:melanin-concentrating hormone receptor 2 [Pelobates cultripes]